MTLATLMQAPKHHPKHLWQKITAVIAKISFVCAAIGVVITLVYSGDVSEEYKAAMGAITFICFAIGVVLSTLGNASIPNLKPDQD
jgi:intracellular septation protein A